MIRDDSKRSAAAHNKIVNSHFYISAYAEWQQPFPECRQKLRFGS